MAWTLTVGNLLPSPKRCTELEMARMAIDYILDSIEIPIYCMEWGKELPWLRGHLQVCRQFSPYFFDKQGSTPLPSCCTLELDKME